MRALWHSNYTLIISNRICWGFKNILTRQLVCELFYCTTLIADTSKKISITIISNIKRFISKVVCGIGAFKLNPNLHAVCISLDGAIDKTTDCICAIYERNISRSEEKEEGRLATNSVGDATTWIQLYTTGML